MSSGLTLTSLDTEILVQIIEYVDDESPLESISLVNHHLHSATKFVAHRHKVLQYEVDHSKANSTLQNWTNNQYLLRGIRRLDIKRVKVENQTDFRPVDVENRWRSLVNLIQKIGNLHRFRWYYPEQLPLIVLRALEQSQPQAELEIHAYFRNQLDTDHNDPAEIAVSRSPSLTVLRATIWSRGFGPLSDYREAAIRRTIGSAPHLKHATILTNGAGGHMRHMMPQDYRDQNDKIELFYTDVTPSTSLRSLTLDGYDITDRTLMDWSRFVDMSKLENLKNLRGGLRTSYFKKASEMLTGLKHVSLNFTRLHAGSSGPRDSIQNFLESCAPLETISFWGWRSAISLRPILERHSKSLRSIQLHEHEEGYHNQGRWLLSLECLDQIQTICPNLRELTIDMDRYDHKLRPEQEAKNIEVFEKLATFKLDKLQIYFDLGTAYLYGSESTFGRDERNWDADTNTYRFPYNVWEEENDEDDEGDIVFQDAERLAAEGIDDSVDDGDNEDDVFESESDGDNDHDEEEENENDDDEEGSDDEADDENEAGGSNEVATVNTAENDIAGAAANTNQLASGNAVEVAGENPDQATTSNTHDADAMEMHQSDQPIQSELATPPPKWFVKRAYKRYRKYNPPSAKADCERYISQIWKIVFGNRRDGSRQLDVKFGEWERKVMLGAPGSWAEDELHKRSFWQVRPEVRDDRKGECHVTVKGGQWDEDTQGQDSVVRRATGQHRAGFFPGMLQPRLDHEDDDY